ncbi:Protein of unknown function [Pyronema omphalodes CBS 100304]|uniref:Uncharacterized protein n=1 Tax=Pyronema omphalodes (strain CBS 100304) TaxID=1076935 RepID=U4LDL9_PYROM|nr:Protein of unknown function [Pyronema omphalodes CBS 100304]
MAPRHDGADDPKTAFYTMPHLSSIPKAPRNPWIYRKAPSYGCSAKNWVAVGGMLRQAEYVVRSMKPAFARKRHLVRC